MDVDSISYFLRSPQLIKRKLSIQEVYQDAATKQVFLRQVKYEQQFADVINAHQVDNSSTNAAKEMPTNPIEETPMEVDSSSDCFEMKRSVRKLRKQPLKMLPYKQLSEETLVPIEKPRLNAISLGLIASAVVLILVAVYMTAIGDPFVLVNHDVQFENVKRELIEQIVGQDGPVEVVLHHLRNLYQWREVKVVALIGSSGVGKTLMLNILKRHFHPALVHDLTLLSLPSKPNFKASRCNLVTVDNLQAANLEPFKEFIKGLPKDMCLLVLPVFSLQYTDDGVTHFVKEDDLEVIRTELEKLNVHFDVALFDKLEVRTVEQWLQVELSRRSVKPSEQETVIKKVLKDADIENRGLKGVVSKLATIGDNK